MSGYVCVCSDRAVAVDAAEKLIVNGSLQCMLPCCDKTYTLCCHLFSPHTTVLSVFSISIQFSVSISIARLLQQQAPFTAFRSSHTLTDSHARPSIYMLLLLLLILYVCLSYNSSSEYCVSGVTCHRLLPSVPCKLAILLV
jgi:hypothetical protein